MEIKERIATLESSDKYHSEQIEDVRHTLYGPDGLCKELRETAISLAQLASAIENEDKVKNRNIGYIMAFIATISLINSIIIGFIAN